MPAAILTAAPRSPVTTVTDHLSAEALNTSILGDSTRLSPEPEVHQSETDTSLCDYERGANTLTPR